MVLGRIKARWEAVDGVPLDRQVRERLDLSWKDAKALVTTGKVHLGGALCVAPQTIPAAGTEVTVDSDRRRPARRPSFGADRILHRDEHLLVVDKPSGLVSLPPTPTGEPTVLDHLLRITKEPVHAVHRLDHGTSGLMVFARTHRAAAALDEALRQHAVRRTYLALCHGPPKSPLQWNTPLTIKKPDASPRKVQAVTHVLDARPVGPIALLHVALETGRWHQVRLHAALYGYPLLGDRAHGDPARDRGLGIRRLALHSHTLQLTHPVDGSDLQFSLELPAALTEVLSRVDA